MQNTERNDVFLQTLATILIRSFLVGLAFLYLGVSVLGAGIAELGH